MDSPRSNANNQLQIVISDVSPSAAAADHDPENYQVVIPEQEREYGCRYCQKKFSNKQALGGHQNAHKVERAMEKNSIGYLGTPPSYSYHHARIPFITPYHRPHDFLHTWPSFPNSQQSGVGIVPYNSRPVPVAGGFNPSVYSGWGRTPSFHGLPARNMNIRLANFGAGSSSAFRPGPGGSNQGMSGFLGLGMRPGGPSAAMNLRNVPGAQQGDDSDLDLSLKL